MAESDGIGDEQLAKQAGGWRGAQTAGKDLLRFGIAIFFAAGFSAVQVFVIPQLLDVTTYGQYRLFLVYVSYLGLLHFGVADGAFLRWVGQPPSTIAREFPVILRWITIIHLGIIAIGGAVALVTTSPDVRTFALAIALGALFINLSVAGAYALQAAGDFIHAGRVAMLSNGLFVILALILRVHTLTSVLALYISAFAVSALYGAWAVRHLRTHDAAAPLPEPLSPRQLVTQGAPVLGASLAAALAQSIDRVLVSILTPITSFALYGFASTANVAAASATQALSRVALSHAARRPIEQRAAFLAGYYDVIATGYGLALLAFPLFDHLVATHIAAYSAALPIVRALTLGLPAWVGTHVVIVGTLQSYGLVRRQLAVEMSGVALVTVLCLSALLSHQPLWIVAAAGSTAAVITLMLGALLVFQSSAPTGVRDTLLFTAISFAQGAALIAALRFGGGWLEQTAIYGAIALLPTVLAAQRARKHGW